MSNFTIGQTVYHQKFNYRGVVIGVDEMFLGSNEWYEAVAHSRPPKDKPWYHVLVHGSSHRTYVAERHLESDTCGQPIEHPELADFFDRFVEGCYSDSRTFH